MTPVADIENRLIQIALTTCPETASVRNEDGGDCGGMLICTLPREHLGRVHFDSSEEIWWSRDAEDADG